MSQHTNVTPMSQEERAAYAVRLRQLATPEAQAGTIDPVAAAAFVAWMADKYAEDVP